MKMFIIAIFLLLVVGTDAQNTEDLQSSAIYKKPSKSRLIKYIGANNQNFYFLRDKEGGTFEINKRRALLERFDNQLKLAKVKELDLEYAKKKLTIEDAILMKNGFYAIYTFFNRSTSVKYLFAQKYDLNTLESMGNIVKLSEQKEATLEDNSFGIKMSKDSTKLLIISHPTTFKENLEFGINVYDADMQSLWNKSEKLKYKESAYSIEQYIIDNNSNAYIVGQIYEKDKVKKKGNYTYDILTYLNNGAKSDDYEIKQGDKYLTNLTFSINKESELVCSGYYSEKDINSIKGVYYFILNPTDGSLKAQNFKPFDFQIRSENMSDRGKRKALEAEKGNINEKSAELNNYEFKDFRLRSDNGGLLISEQVYTLQEGGYNNYNNRSYGFGSPYYSPFGYGYGSMYNNYTPTYYVHHFDHILVTNITPTGEIEWAKKINKEQEIINNVLDNTSFVSGLAGDKIFFIFNGMIPDEKIKGNIENLIMAQINKNGEISYKTIDNPKLKNIAILPKYCRQISNTEVLLYGENMKEFQLFKFKVN
jgi:hypothetical protein